MTTQPPEIPLWDRVEKALSLPYGNCQFALGEHQIDVQVQRKSPLKYSLMVFIDGKWKGEWITNPPEHVAPFMRVSKRYLYKKKLRDEFAKAKPQKRALMSSFGDINKQLTYYRPDWASPKALVRQFKKIPDLRIVEILGITP